MVTPKPIPKSAVTMGMMNQFRNMMLTIRFHLENFSSSKRFHTLSGAFSPKNLPRADTREKALATLRTHFRGLWDLGGICTKHHAKTIVFAWSIKYLRTERKVPRSNLPPSLVTLAMKSEPQPSRAAVVAPSIHPKSN
ncbi:hypothetical protein TNCV_876871 [Trichonephila clavipes]|nr:hypothetical protein TNCV_876871 [Trichonephila clavipes]